MLINFENMKENIFTHEDKIYKFFTPNNMRDNITFQVDPITNSIINVYVGSRVSMYKNILWIMYRVQQERFYNADTGEEIFVELTSNRRCINPFRYGLCTMYNDRKKLCDIIDENGDIIHSMLSFVMFNEDRALCELKYADSSYNRVSIVDRNFNVIKQNVFFHASNYNKEYIIARMGKNTHNSNMYLFDKNGNILSEPFNEITTDDFKTFITHKIGQGRKRVIIDINDIVL